MPRDLDSSYLPVDTLGLFFALYGGFGHDDLGNTLLAGEVEHRLLQHVLANRAQAAGAGLAGERHAGDLVQGRVLKLKIDVLELEHLTVLTHHSVLGLGQDRHQVVLVKRLRLGNDGRTAHELGDHAKGVEVLREHLAQQVVLVDRGGAGDLGVKAHALPKRSANL